MEQLFEIFLEIVLSLFRFGCFTNDCSHKKQTKQREKKRGKKGKKGGKKGERGWEKGGKKGGKKGEEDIRAKQAQCGKIGVLAGKVVH